jgi:hypothetical protein
VTKLTVEEMREHVPLNITDANGMTVRRAVDAFDCETGEVVSYVLTLDGNPVATESELKRRVETYPAPLVWRTITPEQARAEAKRYWDLEGR